MNSNWRADLAVFLRGLLMGIADVVPGVSGGTVALLTGIYPRLVAALSRLDHECLGLFLRGDFPGLARRTEWRFLLALGMGICTGLLLTIFSLVRLLQADVSRPFVLAAFLGMIIAATYLMYVRLQFSHRDSKQESERNPHAVASGSHTPSKPHFGHWGWAILGLVIAIAVTLSRQAVTVDEPSLPYLFLSGVIGISAMILPGISGAMLLLLLGVYGFLVHIPAEVMQGQNLWRNFISLGVFAGGCVTGLVTTTKALKWVLQQWPNRMTCFLLGLMVGAIPCLWPFQTNTTPDQPKLALRIYEHRLPELLSQTDGLIVGTIVIAGVLMIVLARMAHRNI